MASVTSGRRELASTAGLEADFTTIRFRPDCFLKTRGERDNRCRCDMPDSIIKMHAELNGPAGMTAIML